jgi:hypothetical protein
LRLHLWLHLRLRRRAGWSAAPALHPLHLRFELLVAVLQLLDRTGELTDLRFETNDPL